MCSHMQLRGPRLKLWMMVLLVMGLWMMQGVAPSVVWSADEENCMMCHKHRGLGRIDLKGQLRVFWTNEETFARSVHGRVPCRGCHIELNQIPHEIVTNKVDCGVQCHKKEPSTGNDFSHRSVYTNYQRSVHSTDLKNPEPGLPNCKYCHLNPLYTRTTGGRTGPIERIVARCIGCHTNAEYANTFYMHVQHRLMKRTMRSRLEVDQLCFTCHLDKKLLRSKGLSEKGIDAAATYKATYHYRAMVLGRDDTADCIDCHAYYEPYSPHNVHLIIKTTNPESAVHPNNKGKVCAQEECHDGVNAVGPKSGPELADLDLHADFESPVYPVEFAVSQVFFVLTFGTLSFLFFWIFLELFRRLF